MALHNENDATVLAAEVTKEVAAAWAAQKAGSGETLGKEIVAIYNAIFSAIYRQQ
jgi:hypothetical protein